MMQTSSHSPSAQERESREIKENRIDRIEKREKTESNREQEIRENENKIEKQIDTAMGNTGTHAKNRTEQKMT